MVIAPVCHSQATGCAPGDALSAGIAESEVIASAEVLALGAEHLQAIGVVENEQVAVVVGDDGCNALELAIDLDAVPA
jgi:hypothetical protein